MKLVSYTTHYKLKYELSINNDIVKSQCGYIFNIKTGREVKERLNGYSKGYWIGRKFITTNEFNSLLRLIDGYDYGHLVERKNICKT
jgi:hypothetical protein